MKISEEMSNNHSFQGLCYPSILEDWHEGYPLPQYWIAFHFINVLGLKE